jgi:hypothetical protein
MLKLKKAILPGVAGATIGALLAGALWTGGDGGNALAAPNPVNPAFTATRGTSFMVVNMGAAATNVVARFFNQADGGQLSYQPSKTLQPRQSELFDQRYDNSIPNGFAGSAIAEADQRLAAIGYEFTEGPDGGGQDSFNAVGANEVGTSASCPVALKNVIDQAGRPVNSTVHVQNAGSATATVNARFIGLDAQEKDTEQVSIAPGASKSLVLETNAALGNTFFGAVDLSSDQPIAAVVEQYGRAILINYTCFGSGATEINVPLAVKLNEFRTSNIIANTSNSPANVTLTLTNNIDGQVTTLQDQIAPRSAGFYDLGFQISGTPAGGTQQTVTLPTPFFGTLDVTSDQPVATIVQQLSQGDVQQLSFRGVPTPNLAPTVVLPSIYSQIVDANGLNLSTAFALYNPGGADATCQLTFQPSNGTAPTTANKTIGAGRLEAFEQRPGLSNSTFAEQGNFGAVEAQCSQPVGAFGQQLTAKSQEPAQGPSDPNARFGDPIASYMAIPAS